MKLHKLVRIVAAASVLSLLTVLIPAMPALADPVISLSVAKGKIGDTIIISGSGFNASTETTEWHANIYFAKESATTTDDINTVVTTFVLLKSPVIGYTGDTDAGAFKSTIQVPNDLKDGAHKDVVSAGPYFVYITYYNATRIRAVAPFTVIGGKITLTPNTGPVGTQVQVSGSDYGKSELVTINLAGKKITDVQADTAGILPATSITIPETPGGAQTISGFGNTTQSDASATFTVVPKMTAAPVTGSPDASITITGTGFGASRNDIILTLNKSKVAAGSTSAQGSFNLTFKVPAMEMNTYPLEAGDGAGNTAKLDFAVGPTIKVSISASNGNVGSDLTVSGSGYLSGKTLTIKYDDITLGTVNIGADRTFSVAFKIPASKGGAHKIVITDGTAVNELPYTMETTAPPTPQPSLPAMASKVKNPIRFVWLPVTDPSAPVTYTLQVAKTPDFAASGMVWDKKALPRAEYTATEVEKLIALKDAPYYWRVNAMDAASNNSTWSGAGTFYISTNFWDSWFSSSKPAPTTTTTTTTNTTAGAPPPSSNNDGFSIDIPNWLIFIFIGIGALLLFFLGFWVGRRTSYY